MVYSLTDRVVNPVPASPRELRDFHSKDYLGCLQRLASGTVDDEELEEFGLGGCLWKKKVADRVYNVPNNHIYCLCEVKSKA